MVAYRFCRPDDIPLICRAVNECYNVHFPGTVPLTVEGLRSEVKELDVWVSNAMVARQGSEPIGVLMGTKRPDEVLIHRLGVRADYQRQGHGGHMLMSLSHKLAVLGPPRLVAEVPEDLPGGISVFESGGYRVEGELTDYIRRRGPREDPVPEDLFIPITMAELEDQGLLREALDPPWCRSRRTLHNRRDLLGGLAIASPERAEAYVLFRPASPPDSCLDVLAWSCRDPARESLLLDLLLRRLEQESPQDLRIPRLTETEEREAAPFLQACRFSAGQRYRRWVSAAVPA